MSMCDTYLKKIYGWINQCRGEQQKNDANDGMAYTLSSSESEKNQQNERRDLFQMKGRTAQEF